MTRPAFVLAAILAATALAGCKGGDDSAPTLRQTLARLRGPNPTESVEKAFNTEDPDKAREGILELSSHDWGLREPHLKGYATILGLHEHPLVRSAAVTALGKAGDVKYAPDVVTAVRKDPSPVVRCDAALALGNLPTRAAEKALIERALSQREDPQVRTAAAQSLGNYSSKDTLQALVRCMDDPSAALRYRAHESLVTRTGMDMGTQGSDWRSIDTINPVAPEAAYQPLETYKWWDLRRWGWGKTPQEPAPEPVIAPKN